jgi:hypothetical protein
MCDQKKPRVNDKSVRCRSQAGQAQEQARAGLEPVEGEDKDFYILTTVKRRSIR